MPWIYNRIACFGVAAAFLLLATAQRACQRTSYAREQRDLRELDTIVEQIMTRPREEWPAFIEKAQQLSSPSPDIREVRDFCVAAYQKYAAALDSLDRTKAQVAALEAAIEAQDRDAAQQHKRRAEDAMHQTDAALDAAETHLRACAQQRNDLRTRIAAAR